MGASIGGILTPIGTAPNLILLGFLEEQRFPPSRFWEVGIYDVPYCGYYVACSATLLSHLVLGVRVLEI